MAKIGIIPARYNSSRFPGKPLTLIKGKPMIQWVFEQVRKSSLDKIVVATDDDRIIETVKNFGGEVLLTATHHSSGTERCGEIVKILNLKDEDIIVNIQGDEPLIRPNEIELLLNQFDNEDVEIATLIKKIENNSTIVENPNIVKVVFSQNKKALYFSRLPIPYIRDENNIDIIHYKHIGIYGYRCKTLKKIIKLPKSNLELAENLEQLRWIENNFSIHIAECFYESIAIDTPEDLLKLEKLI